jgi:hypothetical protein
MTNNARRQDAATKRIRKLLDDRYAGRHPGASIDVYRYNPAAIRIRIIDPDFAEKSLAAREQEIWPILEELPEGVFSDITVCLLITPDEQPSSLMNLEFDDPQPTRL